MFQTYILNELMDTHTTFDEARSHALSLISEKVIVVSIKKFVDGKYVATFYINGAQDNLSDFI